MMDATITILSVSSLVFNTICACAHGYCLALLYQSRRLSRFTNQRILIANISICEIIFSLAQIRINTCDLMEVTSGQSYLVFERFIRLSALIVFYLALHHITLDRFMEVYYHLRYTVIATKSRIVRIICAYWIASFIVGILLVTATLTIKELTLDKTTEYVFYFSLFADFTVLINAAFTYTYLYIKFRKLNRKEHSQRTKRRIRRTNSLKAPVFAVPLIIVSTYVCFETIGMCLSVYGYLFEFERFELYRKTALVLFCVNYMSDAFVYIYIQPVIRDTIKTHYRTVKSKVFRSEKNVGEEAKGIDNRACTSNANTIAQTASRIEVREFDRTFTNTNKSYPIAQSETLDRNNNKNMEQESEDHVPYTTESCNKTPSNINPSVNIDYADSMTTGIANMASSTNDLSLISDTCCQNTPYMNPRRTASANQISISNVSRLLNEYRDSYDEKISVKPKTAEYNLTHYDGNDNKICVEGNHKNTDRKALDNFNLKPDEAQKIDVKEIDENNNTLKAKENILRNSNDAVELESDFQNPTIEPTDNSSNHSCDQVNDPSNTLLTKKALVCNENSHTSTLETIGTENAVFANNDDEALSYLYS